jgi:pimeloyl-ACP methyl ester carboxylesterase
MRTAACIVAALVLLLARPAAAESCAKPLLLTSDGCGCTAWSPGRASFRHRLCAGLDHAGLDLGATDTRLRTALSCRRIRPARPGADPDAPAWGYEPGRRSQDIAELIGNLEPVPVLLVGWSLGVLDTLAYVRAHGDEKVAGLVLVDNSVGEEPPPPPRAPRRPGPVLPHAIAMHRFVLGMFHHRPSDSYLDRLTEATLRTPESASRALLAYPLPRTYWREAVYSTRRPVL